MVRSRGMGRLGPGGRARGPYLGKLAHAALLLVVGTVTAPAVRAQTIEGVLLSRGTDAPVDLGVVSLLTLDGDSVDAALTDENGRFRVRAEEPGDFLLAATALGYRGTVASSVFSLAVDGRMSLEFRLEPVPIEILGIDVEAQASLMSQPALVKNGFVRRARQGQGRFITPAQIATSNALSTTELLVRTGRVTTRYSVGGDRVLMRGLLGYCTPFVYIDGARTNLSGISLDAIAPLQVIEAIEVYRSAQEAPLQYAVGASRCGVILLWTRTR